jgi:regulator of replication initiation timing
MKQLPHQAMDMSQQLTKLLQRKVVLQLHNHKLIQSLQQLLQELLLPP